MHASILRKIFEEDLADRKEWMKFRKERAKGICSEADFKTFLFGLAKRDKERLGIVKEIARRKELRISSDFFFASCIYQHSPHTEDIAMAYLLALQSHRLGYTDSVPPLWRATASIDRWLCDLGLKQYFGTQWVLSSDGAREMLPKNEDALTMDELKLFVTPAWIKE